VLTGVEHKNVETPVFLLDGFGRRGDGFIGGHFDLNSFDVVAVEGQALVFADLLDGGLGVGGGTAADDDVVLAGREELEGGIETEALDVIISILVVGCDAGEELTALPPVMRTMDLLMVLSITGVVMLGGEVSRDEVEVQWTCPFDGHLI
jgi:hypothetical protein